MHQRARETAEKDPKGLAARWSQLLSSTEGRGAAARWLFSGRVIHAATCVGMTRKEFGLTTREFDLVIVDEAGKAFGGELLVPSLRARKLVLVGDHRQLPPTVTTDILDEGVGYRFELAEVESLLKENFFGRLLEHLPADRKDMLATQHRMHPDIGDVVSGLFYDGLLKSARTDSRGAVGKARVTFVDFSSVRDYRGQRGPQGLSQRNHYEARAALDILRAIRGTQGSFPRTLVVCPYEAQRMDVSELLAREFPGGEVTATTVDAVQGGEASVVLLLMTRSAGRVDFLLDRHRLNVALSRAKDAVVVLGHGDHLRAGDGDNPVRRLLALSGVRHVRVRPEQRHAVGRLVAT